MTLRMAVLLLIAIVLSTGPWAPASAQNVVTLCESDTQAGVGRNLQQALAIGGRITFNCPTRTATIHMTVGHDVQGGTSLHGDDRVTLDARGAVMVMFSVAGGGFAAERITFQNAKWRRPTGLGTHRSSVIDGTGNVTLRNITIQGSGSPVSIRGIGKVVGSGFLNNAGDALYISGEALIEDCSFIGNETGLSLGFGFGSVLHSFFSTNSAGALHVHLPSGEVRIIGSTFDANRGQGALLLSQRSRRGCRGL